ncbi:MAG: phosphate ABC transporter permease subunit PstC [Actinobacteria bacterium RBG_13_35_12]|nr:MAG: phosphate ABC transporter permease subunit PstC [Actinobacteria bacterium RBG_13_35_12]
MKSKQYLKEKIIKNVFFLSSLASIFFLLGISFILFKEGLPLFREIDLKSFLWGKSWYPTYNPPEFGLLPLLLGSLWTTLGALIIAVPLGVSAAIYISELATPKIKDYLKLIIEMLTSVPSVIYGFLGIVVLGPWLQNLLDLPVGLCALTASILLALMAIPTIASLSEEALFSVSKEYKEASYALGATKWETIAQVTVPAAFSGISTAVLLGMGRVIGETMTVLMVAGGAAIIPHSFLQPVRTITATIALEMGETVVGSVHYYALFAIACVLFIISLALNLSADYFLYKLRRTSR